MSKIGKKKILIPKEVNVSINGDCIDIRGPYSSKKNQVYWTFKGLKKTKTQINDKKENNIQKNHEKNDNKVSEDGVNFTSDKKVVVSNENKQQTDSINTPVEYKIDDKNIQQSNPNSTQIESTPSNSVEQ